MLRRMPSVCHFLCVFMIICAGCSIKEDRSGCPCLLVLDFSGIEEDRFHFLTVRVESPDGFLFQETVPGGPFPDRFSVRVPRRDMKIKVYGEALSGVTEYDGDEFITLGEICPDGSYVVPESSGCPPVYLFAEDVSTASDYVEVPVAVRKNYCRISISMLAEGPYMFGLNIVGNICGYDADFMPLSGDFICPSGITDGAVCEVSVPRQTDASLRLQILEYGGVAKDFALGEYIRESGYDWTAEELDDISIVIDYIRTRITFRVRDWEKVFEFNVTI